MDPTAMPFSRRTMDWFFVGLFLINLFFITYIVDVEQILIPDPEHDQQPVWPPESMLPLVFGLTLPWLLVPFLLTIRLWKEHPFAMKEPT